MAYLGGGFPAVAASSPATIGAIEEDLLLDLIETGELRYRYEARIGIAKSYVNRSGKWICVAASLEVVLTGSKRR